MGHICTACQKNNPFEAHFCMECGAPTEWVPMDLNPTNAGG